MEKTPLIKVDSGLKPSKRLTAAHTAVLYMIAVPQVFICFVLAFGDFGFDHPGRYGLDFGHWLALLFLQSLLCAGWTVVCISQRKWDLLVGPFLVVAATIIASSLGAR